MPLTKTVSSLAQLSVDSLTRLFIKGLDPLFISSLRISTSSQPDLNSNVEVLTVSQEDLESFNKGNESCDINNIPDSKPEQKPDGIINDTKNTEDNLIENSTSGQASKLEKVQDFLLCLAQDLTSHAHCSLQEVLFDSLLAALNHLYMKNRCDEMRTAIRTIVPLFINTTLRVLNFGAFKMFTEASMFKAIYEHLTHAEGLEKLVFGRSCFWRSTSIVNLDKAINKMNHLCILHIHYICQPNMLCGLPESCPQLQELSLKGSRDITNTEVPLIIQFTNLTTLDITGTSITGIGCRSLVLDLQHLSWLTHCPFNCNSDTLIFQSRTELFNYIKNQLHRQPTLNVDAMQSPKEVSDSITSISTVPEENLQPDDEHTNCDLMKENYSKKNEIFIFKLRNFWLFNTTTEELLLTSLCPELEHLRLDFVMQDLSESPDMEPISRLPHLTSLALYTYDRCPNELVVNVLASTCNLTNLHLHIGDEWFFVAPIINAICQSCPNLTSLTMEGDYKGQHSLEESDTRLDFTLPPEGLSQLKEAILSGCVTDCRLAHLLMQAPNLETLHLDGELEWLHDDTFTDAIKHNLLLQLKELWFNVSAGITFSSVRRLLQSTNNLKRVGRLCLMSHATREAYKDLLLLVKKQNLSTELIWVTDQRDLKLKTIVKNEQ